MASVRMLAFGALMLLAICMAHDVQKSLLSRPARPDSFSNDQELKIYLQKLKAYIDKGASRYGKRNSAPILQVQPEENGEQPAYKEYAEPLIQSQHQQYLPEWLKEILLKPEKRMY